MARAERLRGAMLALVLASVSLPAAAADPNDKQVAAETKRAGAALRAHDYAGAAAAYERAYQLQPNPTRLFNAAEARRKGGENARAANLYARFLREATPKTNPASVRTANTELRKLGETLARIEVKAAGATSIAVDGETVEAAATSQIFVDAGAHKVSAKFGEREATRDETTTAGQLTVVTLAEPAAPVAAPATAPSTEPVAAAVVTKPPKRDKPLPPIVVYVGAGATVLAGGLALWSGLDTLGQKDTFDEERSQENLDDGRSKQTRTNVLLVVTGGLAVATAVVAVFFVDWKGKKKSQPVGIDIGPGALSVHGVF